jgi:hypothetical protein
MRILFFCAVLFCAAANLFAQQNSEAKSVEKKWFEKISLRGYTQVRYNRLLETNPQLKCEQCDRSIGDNGGFFIRRARLIFSGQVSDNVFIYIQPDLASTATDLHFAQLRDAYFDLSLDSLREFRFRIGVRFRMDLRTCNQAKTVYRLTVLMHLTVLFPTSVT